MRKKRLFFRLILALLFLAIGFCVITVNIGRKNIKRYAVRGVDVSVYQGDIDWQRLAANDIEFVFIKASEGSTYKDKNYPQNIKGAKETELAIGAYHFVSFESGGEAQAKNFINSVDANDISLPPVIDLEMYGRYVKHPPSEEVVDAILGPMIEKLCEEYKRTPIIYTNRSTYAMYLSGKYKDCDIWICDLLKSPTLPDGRQWKFWQYSHTGRLDGYSGDEKHIDLNVFYGSKEEFEEYIKK